MIVLLFNTDHITQSSGSKIGSQLKIKCGGISPVFTPDHIACRTVSSRYRKTLGDLNEVDEELSELQFEKTELDRSLEEANNELNRMRSVFNQRLRDWYMNGMGG